MTDLSDEEEELLRRTQKAARDPYAEDKKEVLRHIAEIPVHFSTTEVLAEHLEEQRERSNSEIAGILLEMELEGLVRLQSLGGPDIVLVHISEAGQERIE